jgi:hypothetical protein
MSKKIVRLSVLAAFSAALGATTWACEDEHPPILATPVETLLIRDVHQVDLLRLAFDPRGVRTVAPRGDDPERWIDSDDPTGAWHYREWQWWKGHPWGESCRPRFYAEVDFRAAENEHGAVIAYHIDGFDCRQAFFLPESANRDAPHFDLVTSIRNDSGQNVDEYAQFFACYTPLNRRRSCWFWDESRTLVRFADRGVGHLDGYISHPQAYFAARGAIPHCPRGGGKLVGRWFKPLLVSHASPAGWRSIIMIEPEFAAALAQGIEGVAMDYILFPGPRKRTFDQGAELSAHIRHVMLRSPELPTIERLEELWAEFERSHAAAHDRAAR